MSNSTHRKKIARRLAEIAGVTYQQAPHAVTAAADAGVLPTHLPGGLDRNLDVAARVCTGWLTAPASPAPDTASASGAVEQPAKSAGPVPNAVDCFTIATTASGAPIELRGKDLRRHACVLGAIGSGKSEAVRTWPRA